MPIKGYIFFYSDYSARVVRVSVRLISSIRLTQLVCDSAKVSAKGFFYWKLNI